MLIPRSHTMSPSKKYCFFFLLSALAYSLIYLWGMIPIMPDQYGGGMGWDPVNTYAHNIDNETVTNWHSSLLLYECIALKYVIRSIFAVEVSGVFILWLVCIGVCVTLLVAQCLLLAYLSKKNKLFLIFFPLFALIPPYTLEFTVSCLGLDYYSIGLIWCLVAVLLLHFYEKNKILSLIYVVLLFIFLLHLVSFRRNAALFIPAIIGYVLYAFRWFLSLGKAYKILVWCACTLFFYVGATNIPDCFLPVKKTHPVTPMLESDMRIASLLQGKQEEYYQRNLFAYNRDTARVKYTISAYWVAGLQKNVTWEDLKEEYIKQWQEHPWDMLAACGIQRIQFYSGGHSFPFLKRWVELKYPSVKENEDAWVPIAPRVQNPLHRMLALVLAPLSVLACCIPFICKRIDPGICFFVIVVGSLSTIYAASYLIVCPTADGRYLMPAHMLALFGVGVLGVELVTRGVIKPRNSGITIVKEKN